MKTIIPSPVLNTKKINEVAQVASSSVSHSAIDGASSESIPFVDDGVEVDESRDGNIGSSDSAKGSPTEKRNGSYRKGEYSINLISFHLFDILMENSFMPIFSFLKSIK